MRIRRFRSFINSCLAALFIAACALSSCSAPAAPVRTQDLQSVDVQALPNYQSTYLQLYYLSGDASRLTGQTKEVRIYNGESRAFAALKELPKVPTTDSTTKLIACIPTGITIERVDVTGSIANVYLSGDFSALDEDETSELFMRQAITNTLCALAEIEGVVIFFDSVQRPFKEAPVGVMNTTNLGQLNDRLSYEKATATTLTTATTSQDVALYYLDAQGVRLLPEVQPVGISQENPADSLITALINGPADPDRAGQALSSTTELRGVEWLEDNTILELRFKGAISPDASDDTYGGELAYGAIVYTLCSYFPGLQGVVFTIDGQRVDTLFDRQLSAGVMRTELFNEYLGKLVTLCFPVTSLSSLSSVHRALPIDAARQGAERLRALFMGTLANENKLCVNIPPDTLSPSDVLGVYLDGDIAYVNLSRAMELKCHEAQLSLQEERALVYAMVNTVTELPGIKRVQFLIEGRIPGPLGGAITLSGPLLRNPGLIE